MTMTSKQYELEMVKLTRAASLFGPDFMKELLRRLQKEDRMTVEEAEELAPVVDLIDPRVSARVIETLRDEWDPDIMDLFGPDAIEQLDSI